jgi:hypothetical protein
MFSKEFFQALNNTWQAIGSDVLQCCEEAGESPDNESCVESCIDADRIVQYGGPSGKAAQEEFRTRMAEVGYGKALKEVCKQMKIPFV